MALLVGRYEYVRELGAGSTGRVLLVRDLASEGAPRAIKVVPAEAASWLRWEFTRLASLSHPRLARVHELLRLDQPVHDLGLTAGSLLLVEAWIEGVSLARFVRTLEGDARERALLRVALGVAEALSAVHDAGLVHGDVKPDNVLVDGAGEAHLVDFGFARPPQLGAAVRGTPRTMAPELYAGVLGFAADVFALGAMLYDLLGGVGGSSGPGRSFVALPGVSADLMTLLQSLVAADPSARPADGRELVRVLTIHARTRGLVARDVRHALSAAPRPVEAQIQRTRALPFVGAPGALDRLVSALAEHDVVSVSGPEGAGRTRFVREAVRLLQRRESERDPPTVVESLSAATRITAERVLLLLDPARAEDIEAAQRAARAFRLSGRHLQVLVTLASARVDVHDVPLEPLSRAGLARLVESALEQPASEGVLDVLATLASGHAGAVCRAISDAMKAGRPLSDPRSYHAPIAEAETWGSARALAELAAWVPAVLEDPARAQAALSAAVDARLALEDLSARGLLSRGPTLCLVPDLALRLRAATRELAQARFGQVALPDAHGFALWLRADERAAEVLLREARAMRAARRLDDAERHLAEARRLLPTPALAREHADVLRALGRPADALAALEGQEGAEALLRRGELLRLLGRRQEAHRALLELAGDAPPGQRATALLARLAFDAGELDVAERLARQVDDASDAEARVRAREVRVLVALARGEAAPVEGLVEAALEEGSPRHLSRALSLRAQVESRAGQRTRALADARRALELSEAAGEALESATFALNVGLLEFEAGDVSKALSALDEAAYRLTLLERASDLSRVLYNLGNLALFVGDFARADLVLREAEAHAERDAASRTYSLVARAELALLCGALDEAHGLLERALEQASEVDLRALVLARRALVQLARGRLDAAQRDLAQAGEPADVVVQAELATARMRAALARGDALGAEDEAERALRELGERLPMPERVRLTLAACDAARAAGRDGLAAVRLLACRGMLERALSGLTPRLRASMRKVAAHARVLESSLRDRPADTFSSPERFRTLLRKSRLLFAASSRAGLFTGAASLLLELVHAERALVILHGESRGALRVVAQADLSAAGQGQAAFSRSVVERALADASPVVTLEVAEDARFDTAQSLHALRVRSVLCVPIAGLSGVLYLDDRVRGAAFSSEDVQLVEDLSLLLSQAHAGLVATREQARRLRRVEREKNTLEGEVAKLAQRERIAGELVFGGAVMSSFVELARRVATSDVPVLLRGESGTGKELVARLIHDASPRRAGPFVAESCAALPETLLESALFGHVRGAFTGADRARRGLFEQADGGTLLLDELGEMSPALQAKLLRVLQEGEVRPVGSERTRKVDVRLVSATHRDLEARVRNGQFREDLYYRVAVVALDVPPLRARREDIALLAAHFVQKHAQGRKVSISPEVLRAFEAASWPGNVRELENQVRRALALCQSRIELAHVLSGVPEPSASDTLDLHTQTDRLTKKLVEEALSRAQGNLTQAAELLGISRFGLQKMVKRLGLGPYVGRARK